MGWPVSVNNLAAASRQLILFSPAAFLWPRLFFDVFGSVFGARVWDARDVGAGTASDSGLPFALAFPLAFLPAFLPFPASGALPTTATCPSGPNTLPQGPPSGATSCTPSTPASR